MIVGTYDVALGYFEQDCTAAADFEHLMNVCDLHAANMVEIHYVVRVDFPAVCTGRRALEIAKHLFQFIADALASLVGFTREFPGRLTITPGFRGATGADGTVFAATVR